ncbi:hypothetical protein L202_00780 [Cryptococcus amylolentus CBS 6039]|uniref:KAP NTPase domain-containing protein n=2 Tax=Cryptococcus amylolentus TaxID=104669 RepID=A0A1E3I8L8_9TREE|nr:hypothetical protein L202_00780 [Cryptococcus amylolentus CBS 6039]ODN84934.1 hypothetical protein L202_00780 [Cryptococcus amylolentus CBS 6039]ODO11366.1 hypothetical protein I350_00145 [Cryptococcus amylolentus CBS 6273]
MVEQTAQFILSHLSSRKNHFDSRRLPSPPLFVGVQGPQGAGKSYLSQLLPAYLEQQHSLRVATFSLDDFYLSHDAQQSLALNSKPLNPLLAGRGPAGTHDLPLLIRTLDGLKNINEKSAATSSEPERTVTLPTYDKSLFHGQGDRSAKGVTVRGPVDVAIFEGWMNGFGALPDEELAARYAAASSPSADDTPSTLVKYSKATLDDINESLRDYEDVWDAIDCFVQIRPLDMSFVWDWRLQQEHNMKAGNGGVGMSDEEVRQFIDRYMPSYELFQDGIDNESTTWHGKGLRFWVDSHRNIVKVEKF